jgi:hypothetical protein
MKPSSLLPTVGVTLAVVLALYAIHLARRVDRHDAASALSQSPLPVQVLVPEQASSGTEDDDRGRKISALGREVARLRVEVVTLRREVKTHAAHAHARATAAVRPLPSDPAPLQEQHDSSDPEQNDSIDPAEEEIRLAQEEEKRTQARLQTIETTLRKEHVDPGWSDQAADIIRQALTSEELAGTSLYGIECRSILCRVEVGHDNPATRAKFESRFHFKVSELLPRLTMHHVEQDDGSSSTVIYLARAGHRFPPVLPTD